MDSRLHCAAPSRGARWSASVAARRSRSGLNGPAWIALAAIVLPLASTRWRSRRYAAASALALGVAIVISAAWPVALYFRAPVHLAAWWGTQTPGDFFWVLDPASSGDPAFLLKNLPWFAWPALPLVVWTLVTRARGFNGGLATPGIELPAVLTLAMCVSIVLMGDPRLTILLPLLVPLSLLAALEIDTLKRGYSGALDWLGFSLSGCCRCSCGGFGSTPTRTASCLRSRGFSATPSRAIGRRFSGSPSPCRYC
jgi:hypothetical protein